MDTFVYSILEGPGCDPEDDIVVEIDRDTDHRYVTLNILDKVLH